MASIWQLSVIVLPSRTIVLGVILNSSRKGPVNSSVKFGNAFDIARSYFTSTFSRGEIEVEWGDTHHSAETDDNGFFGITAEGLFKRDMNLNILLNGEKLTYDKEILNVYSVGENHNLIISDIDDTVVVSHTNKRFKSIMTTLFNTYMERIPVTSTSKIFDALGNDNDIVYVSRSEYNLFPLLSNFMKHHDIPRGPLFLTPFISFTELIRNRKDPDFKIKVIKLLLRHSKHEQIVLIGDDTQHDLQVYSEIAKSYGDRIRKIFIRQTNLRKDRRQSAEWKELDHYVNNMVYFNDTTDFSMLNY
jgi:phosphatidate phosphatase APP1